MKAKHSYNLALWLGAATAAALAVSQPGNAQAPAQPPAAARPPAAAPAPAAAAPAAPAPAAPAAPAAPPAPPPTFANASKSAVLNWSNSRLLNAEREPQNWLMQGHDVEAHRYSALTAINRSNVSQLHVAYGISLGGANDVAGKNGPNNIAPPPGEKGLRSTVSAGGGVV